MLEWSSVDDEEGIHQEVHERMLNGVKVPL